MIQTDGVSQSPPPMAERGGWVRRWIRGEAPRKTKRGNEIKEGCFLTGGMKRPDGEIPENRSDVGGENRPLLCHMTTPPTPEKHGPRPRRDEVPPAGSGHTEFMFPSSGLTPRKKTPRNPAPIGR